MSIIISTHAQASRRQEYNEKIIQTVKSVYFQQMNTNDTLQSVFYCNLSRDPNI